MTNTNGINMPSLPVRAVDLVPHRGILLVLDELCEYTPQSLVGKTVITAKNPFVDSNMRLTGVCLMELMAQLTAAGKGYEAKMSSGPVGNGYLIGIENFIILEDTRAGDVLTIKLSKTFEMLNITYVEGGIYRENERIATGKLKLYELENPDGQLIVPLTGYTQEVEVPKPLGRSMIYGYIAKNVKVTDNSLNTGRVAGEFCFNRDFPGLGGHFPGYPVLPGIAMIDLSIALSEAFCGNPLMLTSLEHAKFMKPVLPENTIKVEINIKLEDGIYKVRSQLSTEGVPVAKFACTLKRDILNT